MERPASPLCDKLLNAAEAVVARQGIANLTLEAVAAEAGVSKGGLLHHFPSKDQLIAALVTRSANNWRQCYTAAHDRTPEGPGRMVRGLLNHCLSDAECWTEELRRSTSAVFAALAQDPSLIQPMRAAYTELHQRILADGLPTGVSEAVMAALDGLWLNWVLGLTPLDQERVVRVRRALEEMLSRLGQPDAAPASGKSRPQTAVSRKSKPRAAARGKLKAPGRSSPGSKAHKAKRAGGRRR